MVIKGEGTQRLLTGVLIRDAEFSTFGTNNYSKTRFCVKASNGDNGLVNIEAIFELADQCRDLKKGDRVIVAGSLDNWVNKNGDKRWFVNADFIGRAINQAVVAGVKQASEGFEDIKVDEEELPFF